MIVLSVDQSYKRCGLSVVRDGNPVLCESLNLSKIKTKKEKRHLLRTNVRRLIQFCQPDFVTVERVRTFSGGWGGGKKPFIALHTILALGSLVTAVIDASSVPVYSVDTRAWKAAVLGSAKASKQDAVGFARQYGYEVDDDAADALCMAFYACLKNANLKEEQ